MSVSEKARSPARKKPSRTKASQKSSRSRNAAKNALSSAAKSSTASEAPSSNSRARSHSSQSGPSSSFGSMMDPAQILGMREFQDKARDGSNKARANLEAGTAAAQKGISEIQSVMLEAFRAHTDATLNFWRSLAGARSLSEVVLIQTSGARRAYDLASENWQRMAQVAGQSMNEALEQQTRNVRKRA